LLSRKYDRTRVFREPFRPLIDTKLPPMVFDGEIAVPDDRGVTHLDALNDAISEGRLERLAYFAFDLLHLDGHDLRRCAIEDRKMLLRASSVRPGASGSSTLSTCAGLVESCLKPCNT
jgi:ATP-dependent DNA ligase